MLGLRQTLRRFAVGSVVFAFATAAQTDTTRQRRDAGMGVNDLCCLRPQDSEIHNETASFQNEKDFSDGLHLTRRGAWRVACLSRGGQGVIA